MGEFPIVILIFEDGYYPVTIGRGSWQYSYHGAFASSEALQYVYIGRKFNFISENPYDTKYPPFYDMQSYTSCDVVLGKNIDEVQDSLFMNFNNISTVSCNNEIKRIGDFAFQNCWMLNRVELGNSIEEISNHAFDGCFELSSIDLPTTLKSLGDYCFHGCGLTSVNIPSSIEEIPINSFENCWQLSNVVLNEGLKYISNYAFQGSGIEELIIPTTLQKIDFNAFDECNSLTKIETIPTEDALVFDPGNVRGSLSQCPIEEIVLKRPISYSSNNSHYPYGPFAQIPTLKKVTFGEMVIEIPKRLFYECSGLDSIFIPSTIETVQASAFYGCSSLSKLIIEDGVSVLSLSSYGDTDFGQFSKSPLEFLYLGRNLSYVDAQSYGYSPFGNISTPFSVEFGENITYIGNCLFYGCTGITELNFPNNLASIGEKSFSGCTGLTEIVFPENLTFVNSFAFENCSNIKKVTFEKCVSDGDPWFQNGVFYADYNISEITCYCDVPPRLDYGSTWWMVDKETCKLRVPALSIDAYKSHTTWEGFYNIEAIEKLDQTIEWNQEFDELFVGDSVELTAEASSGLEVEYAVTNGQGLASISSNTLTLLGTGTITITATQPGNEAYQAVSVSQELTINKRTQSLMWNQALDPLYVEDIVTLTAEASSGLEVEYSIIDGQELASIEGNILTILGAGEITIEASQSGNNEFELAEPMTKTFTAVKKDQSIIWDQEFIDVIEGDEIELTAVASSGLPVEYAMWAEDNPPSDDIILVTGNIIIVPTAGMINIEAYQFGNNVYEEAEPVRKSFVAKERNSLSSTMNDSRKVKMDGDNLVLVGFSKDEVVRIYLVNGTLIYSGTDRLIPVSPNQTYIVSYNGASIKLRNQ